MKDLGIVTASIIAAWWLSKSGVLLGLLSSLDGYVWFASFVAGMFFTSVFTTAPAIVALSQIASQGGILPTAFLGALGALVGDLIIFRYIENELGGHLAELLSHRRVSRRLRALMHLPIVRYLSFLVGGLIIASPIPDEIGIGLMGAVRMDTRLFAACSFAFNFIGIIIIGLVAQAI